MAAAAASFLSWLLREVAWEMRRLWGAEGSHNRPSKYIDMHPSAFFGDDVEALVTVVVGYGVCFWCGGWLGGCAWRGSIWAS